MTTALTYTVLINSAPFSRQSSDSAYHFCRALMRQGQRLLAVFFYGDAVHNASCLVNAPGDEPTLPDWQQLAAGFNFDLLVCSTAAQRRGILDHEAAQQTGQSIHNLAPGFTLAGLAQLVTLAQRADRFISFGGYSNGDAVYPTPGTLCQLHSPRSY